MTQTPAAGPPRVTVVIPARDAEALIGRALAALERQTIPRDAYEVVVVDDASADETAARAEAAGARVVRLPSSVGSGAARNAGVAVAHGQLVVFTDADCEPTERFLETLIAPMAQSAVGGTKGTYLSRQQRLVARFVQAEYEDRYRREASSRRIDFVDTYAACFRRSDLQRIGGFDGRLRQCVDQELSFRMAEAGLEMRFVEAARTYHLHADTLRGYLRKKYGIAWWKVAVLRRHPGKAVHDSHTPQSLKLEMLAAGATALGMVAAPLLAAAGVGRRSLLPAAGGGAAFLSLSAPFAARTLARDPAVALVAPGILFLRDLALGAGLAAGLIAAPRLVEVTR
jgi:GT2 family glycosyltransferase